MKGKGQGGKLTRSEVVQVRLDPKLRFAAELAAAKERRTLSSFIEWATAKAVHDIVLAVSEGKSLTAHQVAHQVWSPDPDEQLANLATQYPHLLTCDETAEWKRRQQQTGDAA